MKKFKSLEEKYSNLTFLSFTESWETVDLKKKAFTLFERMYYIHKKSEEEIENEKKELIDLEQRIKRIKNMTQNKLAKWDKYLDCSSYRILTEKNIPQDIFKIKYLQVLKIPNNQLTTIPGEIYSLISLRELYLNNNKITTIPQEIINLTQLQKLDISRNKLQYLCGDFSYFILDKNPTFNLIWAGNPFHMNFHASAPSKPSSLFEWCILNVRQQFFRNGTRPQIHYLALDIKEKLMQHRRYCCMCGLGLVGDGKYLTTFRRNALSEILFLVWFCTEKCSDKFFKVIINTAK